MKLTPVRRYNTLADLKRADEAVEQLKGIAAKPFHSLTREEIDQLTVAAPIVIDYYGFQALRQILLDGNQGRGGRV